MIKRAVVFLVLIIGIMQAGAQEPGPFAKLIPDAEERTRLASSLAAFSRTLKPAEIQDAVLKKEAEQLQQHLLLMAVALDPTNRVALVTRNLLGRGVQPEPVPDTPEAKPLSDGLMQRAETLGKAGDADEKKLAAYFTELAAAVDPSNENAAYEAEILKQRGGQPEWALLDPSKPAAPAASVASSPVQDRTGPVRKQASMKGLFVSKLRTNDYAGFANDIIATEQTVPAAAGAATGGPVQNPYPSYPPYTRPTPPSGPSNVPPGAPPWYRPPSGNPNTAPSRSLVKEDLPGAVTTPFCSFAQPVGKDMALSLDDAARFVQSRYPKWDATQRVVFSFGDKYSFKDGGSAGGVFGLILMSMFSDKDIDPGFTMTGDLTSDGKIRAIGAVSAKLRGAVVDHCTIAAVPEENKDSVADMILLDSTSNLWGVQVFSVGTLDQAMEVANTPRPEKIAQAIDAFNQAKAMGTRPGPLLPDQKAKLKQVLELAPNHLSALYLLDADEGRLPARLSIKGSIEEAFVAATPVLRAIKDPENEDRVPVDALLRINSRLGALKKKADPRTSEVIVALDQLTAAYQSLSQSDSRATTLQIQMLESGMKRLRKAMDEIATDKAAVEELLR